MIEIEEDKSNIFRLNSEQNMRKNGSISEISINSASKLQDSASEAVVKKKDIKDGSVSAAFTSKLTNILP